MQILQSNHVFNLVGNIRPGFNYKTLSFSCEKCKEYVCAYQTRGTLLLGGLIDGYNYAYLNKSKTKISIVKFDSGKLIKIGPSKCTFTYDDVLTREIIE